MDIYIKLFEVLFPVFFVIGIGYYLGKKNSKIDTSFITNFAANIGTPAMIIYAVTSTGITFDIFKEYFWYYLLAIIYFEQIGDEKNDFFLHRTSSLVAFEILRDAVRNLEIDKICMETFHVETQHQASGWCRVYDTGTCVLLRENDRRVR